MKDITGIDRTDFGILKRLMEDARLSNKEMAAAIDLAPSSCYERIKNLRRRGILLGSHAEVDFQSLGLSVEALLFVQVAKMEANKVDVFRKEIASIREVRSVFLISGHFDLMVHVVARNMEQLKGLISEHFNRHPRVIRVETSIVFDRQTRHEIPVSEADF
jgi:DNA-binding Lrp family transcriptional regulator